MSSEGSRRRSSTDAPAIANVVYALKQRSGNELGASTSARLFNVTYDSICDWIGAQRISHLPPEGSPYDKVLAWAELFVERLHSFDMAIGEFVVGSNMAAQLAYGYCSILLEVTTLCFCTLYPFDGHTRLTLDPHAAGGGEHGERHRPYSFFTLLLHSIHVPGQPTGAD